MTSILKLTKNEMMSFLAYFMKKLFTYETYDHKILSSETNLYIENSKNILFKLTVMYITFIYYSPVISIQIIIANLISYFNNLAITHDPKAFDPINKYQRTIADLDFFFNEKQDKEKYVIQEHKVTTEDGYILKMFRINLSQKYKQAQKDKQFIGKPVLGIHGMKLSADLFICTKQSPGFYFIDQGYDLWLGNLRGTKYCLEHKNMDIDSKSFFNYSVDEYAYHDIPKFYEKILENVDSQKILLLAFSLGSTSTVMSLSEEKRCEFMNRHTERVILLAPQIYYACSKDPMIWKPSDNSYVEFEKKSNEWNIHSYGMGNNCTDLRWLKLEDWMIENYDGWDLSNCDFKITDWNHDNAVKSFGFYEGLGVLFPFLNFFGYDKCRIAHGDGISVKMMIHVYQQRLLGKMSTELAKYDYGPQKNLEVYGSKKKPVYNQSNIKVKVDCINGEFDLLCNQHASNAFINKINQGKTGSEKGTVSYVPNWRHGTFLCPKDTHNFHNLLDNLLFHK